METRSPLARLDASDSWVVFRRAGDSVSEAWASLPDGIHEAKGAAAAGLKSKVEAAGGAAREIGPAWLAFPTGFDLQVHLRFPGQSSRETLAGGLYSAHAGGYDTVVTMPNTNPFLDDPALVAKSAREAEAKAKELGLAVRVLFTGAGTVGMKGEAAADVKGLARAGAVAITDDGWGVRSPEAMQRIFELCREADVPFLQHAEMPGHKGHASESAFQKKNGVPPYPRTAESEMVRRDLELLAKVPGARYHVLHISTRETLDEVRKGKEAGLDVTCEVTPHHLLLSNADIPGKEDPLCTSFKMNPPLFAPEDREALVEALASGLIDCVSTDHAPHETEAKRAPWKEAPFGTRGMETALPALVTLLWEGKLTADRLRAVWTVEARKIARASAPTGWLFVDPAREYKVDESELPGISKNSCFLGKKLRGRIDLRGDKNALYTRS